MPDQTKEVPSAPRQVGAREFRSSFSGFVRQIRHGSSFAVTSRDTVVAIISPPPQQAPCRWPGTLRGQIEMAPNFDAMGPDLPAALDGSDE